MYHGIVQQLLTYLRSFLRLEVFFWVHATWTCLKRHVTSLNGDELHGTIKGQYHQSETTNNRNAGKTMVSQNFTKNNIQTCFHSRQQAPKLNVRVTFDHLVSVFLCTYQPNSTNCVVTPPRAARDDVECPRARVGPQDSHPMSTAPYM